MRQEDEARLGKVGHEGCGGSFYMRRSGNRIPIKFHRRERKQGRGREERGEEEDGRAERWGLCGSGGERERARKPREGGGADMRARVVSGRGENKRARAPVGKAQYWAAAGLRERG